MGTFKQTKFIINLCIILCHLQEYVFADEIHSIQASDAYVAGKNKKAWKKIQNENVYGYAVWDAVSPHGSVLYLRCIASYPIQWTFTGHYFPANNVEFLPPKRYSNDSIYQITVCLIFPERDQTDWAVSVRAACKKIGNPKVDKSVLVFVRKNSYRALLGPRWHTVLDSRLIPCPTKDPNAIPLLYKRTRNKGVIQVTDPSIKYNFYQGFRSTKTFSGYYICRWQTMSVTVTTIKTLHARESFEIIPRRNSIRVFSEDAISFTCASPLEEDTHLTLDDADGKLNVTYELNNEKAVISVSRESPSSLDAYVSPDSKIQGTGKCTLTDETEVVLKQWTYEFLSTPELYINNFFGTFDCVSNVSPTSIHVFRCNNKMECSFVTRFPVDADKCYWAAMTHVSSSEQTFCILGREEQEQPCVRLQFTFNSGLVQCKVDGLVKQWEFFTSLDNRKYTNWKDAPETELVRMDDGGNINGVTRLFCSAVSYLFADGISFEIEFKNGSTHRLHHNGKTVNISDDHNVQQVEGRTNVGILLIILPHDTAAIHCVATWWNGTGEMRTSKKFDLGDEDSEEILFYCLVGTCGIISICGVATLLLILVKRHKTTQEVLRDLTDEEVEQFFKGRPELLAHKAVYNIETADLLPFPKKYEIPFHDLEFDTASNFLGSGNFSYVVRGRIISKGITVAIKIAKETANVNFFKSLLSEVKIMVYIGKHENVLSLAGVCTQNIRNRRIHIATDVCELGDLKNFLMKSRPSFENIINAKKEIDISLLSPSASPQRLTILDLIRFACEIAKGMEYLAYKWVVHADLAARNVLLTSAKVVKISDFGLSKKLYEDTNYVKKSLIPLPWRWMAIESLTTLTFSTSSDVYAYGVTLFEVFSLGDTPYPNEEWNAGFLVRLEDGMRLGRPKHCTKEIYHIMSECWEKEPELRPSFSTLRSFFEKLSGRYVVPGKSGHRDVSTDSLESSISLP